MVFFQETIYLEQKRWSMCDKSLGQKNKRAHCVSLFIDRNPAIYFDSFRIEYIPQDKKYSAKSKINQDNESIVCGFYFSFSSYCLYFNF